MARRTLTAHPMGMQEAFADKRLIGIELAPKQAELVNLIETHGTTIAAAGRQGGKSLIGAGTLVHNVTLRPDLDERMGGSPRYGLCVANSREQATIVLGYARGIIERSPLLRSQLRAVKEDRLVLEGGRVLLAMPCSDRLMRGLVASAVILDELAHFLSETDGPAVADRVYAAVRPSLTTFEEQGRLVAISTPMGSDNLFARLHAKAESGELGPHAAAFTAGTAEMNPRVGSEALEQERLQLGDADFAREYLAQFTGGSGSFFEEDAVRSVVGRYRELAPDEGVG